MRRRRVSSSALRKSWLVRWVARTSNSVEVSAVTEEAFVVRAAEKTEEEEEQQMSEENVAVEEGCLREREDGTT